MKQPSDIIKETYSIWDIAAEIQAPLSKTGNSRPPCPFCKSKTGFSVKKDKFFHCYRCQRKGSGIDFAMEWLEVDFVQAVRRLNKNQVKQFDLYQNLREEAFSFYQEAFKESKEAQQYAQNRGWDYPMGYAPHSSFLQRKGLSKDSLSKIALTSHYNSDLEFFNNRIIFPIRDSYGIIKHFQGRSIDTSSSIKWLSTSGGDLSINHYLFNGEKLKTEYKEKECLFICEGIGDALAMDKLGLPALAILGNQMPLRGYKSLLESFEAICFCLDNDVYELGTPEFGNLKSWTRMLPEIIDFQNSLPIPVYCFQPPSISGVSDINEFCDRLEYDSQEFLNTLYEEALPVEEKALRVFNNKEDRDLYWLCQSLKSPFTSEETKQKVKSQIEISYPNILEFLIQVL